MSLNPRIVFLFLRTRIVLGVKKSRLDKWQMCFLPTANLEFSTRASSKKVSAITDCDCNRHREVAIWRRNRKYLCLLFWNYENSIEIPTVNLGFWTVITSKKMSPKRKWQHWRQNGHIAISGCRSLSLSQSPKLHSSSLSWSKTRFCRWNFDNICYNFEDISISVLRGHIANNDDNNVGSCWSSSKSFRDTVFENVMVDSSRFVVGISILSVVA